MHAVRTMSSKQPGVGSEAKGGRGTACLLDAVQRAGGPARGSVRTFLGWRSLGLGALVGGLAVNAAEPSFYQARIASILERHCVACHGPAKQKAGLRLDSYEWVVRGAESGPILKVGDLKGSELHRRITLPATDEEVMPNEGKPLLAREEIKNIECWIAGGASATASMADFPDAPALPADRVAPAPLVDDWSPRAAEIAALERVLSVRLVPRSQVPTDGLILRTASAPTRVDDTTLAKLAPLAPFIIEAELARTRVTDTGLQVVATWQHLRALDLTRTAISSAGLAKLMDLRQLEVLNLTETPVDELGVAPLRTLPALKRIWLYGTKAAAESSGRKETP